MISSWAAYRIAFAWSPPKSVYDIGSIGKDGSDSRFKEQIQKDIVGFLFASGKYFENYHVYDIPVSPTPLNSPLNLRCCLKLERCLRLENRRRRGRKEIERGRNERSGSRFEIQSWPRRSEKGRGTVHQRRNENEGEGRTREHPVIISGTQEPRAGSLDPVFSGHMFHPRKQNNNRVHTLIGWPNPRVYAQSRAGTGFNCERACYRQRARGIHRRNKWKKKIKNKKKE